MWIKAAVQALPSWRYKDIITLPFSVVELARDAANERRDEQNKFIAAIAGVDLDKSKSSQIKNDKSQVAAIKTAFISGTSAKSASKADIQKAIRDKKKKT